MPTDAPATKEDGPAAVQPNQDREHDDQGRKDDEEQGGAEPVQQPSCGDVADTPNGGQPAFASFSIAPKCRRVSIAPQRSPSPRAERAPTRSCRKPLYELDFSL